MKTKRKRQILISNRCKGLRLQTAAIRKALSVLDHKDAFPLPPGDLSIAFFDDQWMSDLHATFLSDPTPTDVITFPGYTEDNEAGEICVGAERAWEVHKSGTQPFPRELMLYVIHGWLHLYGFDDKNEADQKKMRQAEEQAFSRIEAIMTIPHASYYPPGS